MSKPLDGKRIVVTRARTQSARLSERLRALGASVIEVPVIRFVELDPAPLERAMSHIDRYDLVIFTSVNAVSIFCRHLSAAGRPSSALAGRRIAAIGIATARALEQNGVHADVVPDDSSAEGLIKALRETGISLERRKVLLPRARVAREVLAAELASLGAEIDDIALYETVPEPFAENPEIMSALSDPPDVLTFTSSSCARSFKDGAGAPLFDLLKNKCIAACIGPVTAETARSAGFDVRIVPAAHSIEALVDAIAAYFT